MASPPVIIITVRLLLGKKTQHAGMMVVAGALVAREFHQAKKEVRHGGGI